MAVTDRGVATGSGVARAAYKRLRPAQGILFGVAGSLVIWGVLGVALLPF